MVVQPFGVYMATKNSSRKKPTAAQLAATLIISVGEARKTLGADAKGMSDDDIALYVYALQEIAPKLLYTSISQEKQL